MYADMFKFKMALATHVAIKENRYFIQKSDTGVQSVLPLEE
jgi:hypothetical protein